MIINRFNVLNELSAYDIFSYTMGLLGCSSIVKSRKICAEICYHADKPQKHCAK